MAACEQSSACTLRFPICGSKFILLYLGSYVYSSHSKDGKSPGVECVILGGSHGDFPIEPTGGAVVADMVVDETANFIIDFSRKPSGEMW